MNQTVERNQCEVLEELIEEESDYAREQRENQGKEERKKKKKTVESYVQELVKQFRQSTCSQSWTGSVPDYRYGYDTSQVQEVSDPYVSLAAFAKEAWREHYEALRREAEKRRTEEADEEARVQQARQLLEVRPPNKTEDEGQVQQEYNFIEGREAVEPMDVEIQDQSRPIIDLTVAEGERQEDRKLPPSVNLQIRRIYEEQRRRQMKGQRAVLTFREQKERDHQLSGPSLGRYYSVQGIYALESSGTRYMTHLTVKVRPGTILRVFEVDWGVEELRIKPFACARKEAGHHPPSEINESGSIGSFSGCKGSLCGSARKNPLSLAFCFNDVVVFNDLYYHKKARGEREGSDRGSGMLDIRGTQAMWVQFPLLLETYLHSNRLTRMEGLSLPPDLQTHSGRMLSLFCAQVPKVSDPLVGIGSIVREIETQPKVHIVPGPQSSSLISAVHHRYTSQVEGCVILLDNLHHLGFSFLANLAKVRPQVIILRDYFFLADKLLRWKSPYGPRAIFYSLERPHVYQDAAYVWRWKEPPVAGNLNTLIGELRQ
jgi:hypothetical protein